jgi:4-hydroxy 2-oxovalerate aldolase
MSRIHVLDTTCRDGSHAVGHRHSATDTAAIVSAVAGAGVSLVEVAHGDGLSGGSLHFGIGLETDLDYVRAAVKVSERSRVCALLVPGLGTVQDLLHAIEVGLTGVRVATHVTEADLARTHLLAAREQGLLAIGFLMMTHMAEPDQIAESARTLEGYGADVVYLADSAGYQLPDDIARRVHAVREAVSVEVGVHTHNNLGLAIGNALAAAGQGATYIDGTLCGLGAGAGNAQLEVLVAVLERAGYETGVDLEQIMTAANKVVRPLLPRPQVVDSDGLMIGHTGLYSTFLLPTRHAAARYGVGTIEILRELGKRQLVAGQEDLIIDVAYELSRAASVHGVGAGGATATASPGG